jgi:hypothetical protein
MFTYTMALTSRGWPDRPKVRSMTPPETGVMCDSRPRARRVWCAPARAPHGSTRGGTRPNIQRAPGSGSRGPHRRARIPALAENPSEMENRRDMGAFMTILARSVSRPDAAASFIVARVRPSRNISRRDNPSALTGAFCARWSRRGGLPVCHSPAQARRAAAITAARRPSSSSRRTRAAGSRARQ